MARPPTEKQAKQVELLPLADLHLDRENPRFGGSISKKAPETELLDAIVETFGVDDVLSSLATNGYFGSEPLVGFRPKGTADVVIAEGNRRLAACLVLERDPRAKNQKERSDKYDKSARPKITKVPVLVYEAKDELLAFMGVRHIAAQNPWDSYAKAHWIAEMLEQGRFSLGQISNMIGDQYNTIERMLEGYYFSAQLQATGKWTPATSLRPGRGSNPQFPFSWVYTALGYTALRQLLGLDPSVKKNPVPAKKVDDAIEFVEMMFGNKAKSREPVIRDSREIGDLAAAMHDARQAGVLRTGAPLAKALKEGIDPSRRIEDGFIAASESLKEAAGLLAASKLTDQHAQRLQPLSKEVRFLAIAADKAVLKVLAGDEDGDE